MSIKDKNIPWKLKREYIPVHMMAGLLEATNLLTSLGAGTTVFKEAVAAAQISGLQLTTADEIFHYWPLPWDLDRGSPLRFRLHFIHSAGDADSPVFKVFYKGIGKQIAVDAANSSEDEVLSITHLCVATADALEITNWKRSDSHHKIVTADRALLIAVELDALGGASADEIALMGLEIEWKVQATMGYFSDTKDEPITI